MRYVSLCVAAGLILAVSGTAQGVTTTWTVDPSGPRNFNKIRTAIAGASSGDTIHVLPGTYTDATNGSPAKIDTTNLTIMGWDTGAVAGPGVVNIDVAGFYGSGSGNNVGFAIRADHTTMSGFTVTFNNPDGGIGIGLASYDGSHIASDCTISGNVVSGFRWGIQQYGSNYYPASGNEIVGNTLYGNGYGIELFDAGIDGTLVAHNTAYGNTGGIAIVTAHLGSITNVTVEGNRLYDNTGYAMLFHDLFGSGIGVLDNIAITGNDMTNNNMGVYVTASVPDASGISVNYNNIVNDTPNKWGVYNGATGTVLDATHNWWGDVDGPGVGGATKVSGDVAYDPWLTEPIPEPLTMLGVFAGIAGIGAYLRRRSRA